MTTTGDENIVLSKEILKLENQIAQISNSTGKIEQSKKILSSKSSKLNEEIEDRKREILKYTTEIAKYKERIKAAKEDDLVSFTFFYTLLLFQLTANNNNLGANAIDINIKEKKISDDIKLINQNYNQSLYEKLKTNINSLISIQKNLRINYIIVKKLELKQEFLNSFRLNDDNT